MGCHQNPSAPQRSRPAIGDTSLGIKETVHGRGLCRVKSMLSRTLPKIASRVAFTDGLLFGNETPSSFAIKSKSGPAIFSSARSASWLAPEDANFTILSNSASACSGVMDATAERVVRFLRSRSCSTTAGNARFARSSILPNWALIVLRVSLISAHSSRNFRTSCSGVRNSRWSLT